MARQKTTYVPRARALKIGRKEAALVMMVMVMVMVVMGGGDDDHGGGGDGDGDGGGGHRDRVRSVRHVCASDRRSHHGCCSWWPVRCDADNPATAAAVSHSNTTADARDEDVASRDQTNGWLPNKRGGVGHVTWSQSTSCPPPWHTRHSSSLPSGPNSTFARFFAMRGSAKSEEALKTSAIHRRQARSFRPVAQRPGVAVARLRLRLCDGHV